LGKSQVALNFIFFNLIFLRFEGDRRRSLVLKKVYYSFINANVNLFINAYYERDYNQLHKSFYSVAVSISLWDILKSYALLFAKYAYTKMNFERSWLKYKTRQKKKYLEDLKLKDIKTVD
jgi:hypothetical protein